LAKIHVLVCFFCSDIYSVSNVLTSEFQSAILLRCQDETETSLVEYLCHGQGLLLLQMLYILASKVLTCRQCRINSFTYMYRITTVRTYTGIFLALLIICSVTDHQITDSIRTQFWARYLGQMGVGLTVGVGVGWVSRLGTLATAICKAKSLVQLPPCYLLV